MQNKIISLVILSLFFLPHAIAEVEQAEQKVLVRCDRHAGECVRQDMKNYCEMLDAVVMIDANTPDCPDYRLPIGCYCLKRK